MKNFSIDYIVDCKLFYFASTSLYISILLYVVLLDMYILFSQSMSCHILFIFICFKINLNIKQSFPEGYRYLNQISRHLRIYLI